MKNPMESTIESIYSIIMITNDGVEQPLFIENPHTGELRPAIFPDNEYENYARLLKQAQEDKDNRLVNKVIMGIKYSKREVLCVF